MDLILSFLIHLHIFSRRLPVIAIHLGQSTDKPIGSTSHKINWRHLSNTINSSLQLNPLQRLNQNQSKWSTLLQPAAKPTPAAAASAPHKQSAPAGRNPLSTAPATSQQLKTLSRVLDALAVCLIPPNIPFLLGILIPGVIGSHLLTVLLLSRCSSRRPVHLWAGDKWKPPCGWRGVSLREETRG